MPRAEPGGREGGCLCGAVRYRTRGPLRPVLACHCGQCRRTSGHFVAATAADNEALAINDPEGRLTWYRSSSTARRGFCGRCGSSLTADKGDYYTLDNDITSFPAGR